MDRSTLVNLFDQIIEGWDIPTPSALVKVKAEDAEMKLPGLPYSMLTNLAHIVTWQRIWLKKLNGLDKASRMEDWKQDWRVPKAKEWDPLRKEFLTGLLEARRIAASEPMDQKLKSDEEASKVLTALAIHAAYHMGQLNVLKRGLRARKSKA